MTIPAIGNVERVLDAKASFAICVADGIKGPAGAVSAASRGSKVLRLLFGLVALLLVSNPASAAITFVAAGSFTGGQFGGAGSAVNAASAKIGVVVAAWYGNTSSDLAVSDDSGNSNVWVRRINHYTGATSLNIWDCRPALSRTVCTFLSLISAWALVGPPI
jgi:hypothetical protein